MQSNWYTNDGAGSGNRNVYDGGGSGGYYGCDNVSFYGPPAMGTMDYMDKVKPGFDATSNYPGGNVPGPPGTGGNFPCGVSATVSNANAGPVLPYQNVQQGLGPHQPHPNMLYNQSQMVASTVMGSNNDYQQQHHQQPHVPSSSHHLVSAPAYQPFCQALPPPSHQQSSYGSELGKPPEVVSQSLVSSSSCTPSFLEQPYVAANYAPCQGPPPWNYAYCYGYYGQEPCPYVNMVDMEDFM